MLQRLEEILIEAINLAATDVHFTLKDESLTIEMRVNDRIMRINSKDADIRLLRYIQYRANLDMSNEIRPQTGSFEMEVNNYKLSLRFALIKSFGLTCGVLRILNTNLKITLDSLLKFKEQKEAVRRLLNHRAGLILISGPTGSGKTTTLYTLLNTIRNKKVFTIEDPIEIYSSNYVQLQVNESINFGYDEGIKQLLRHDPDVIMIGEIRDETAANMAIRCALTGHLVISSIHASSCSGCIERMLELKVNPTQLKDVLIGVTNQRLYTGNSSTRKVAVYEIMEKEGVEYFFKYQSLPKDYKDLKYYLRKAVDEKFIKYNKVEADLN